jgi:hypothetical protein
MAGHVEIDEQAIAEYFATHVVEGMDTIAGNVLDEAQRLVPVDTGRLRDSLHKERDDQAGRISFTVGSDVDYAADVELGAGAETIHAQPGHPLHWVEGGVDHYATVIHVPPRRAEPYLRPSLFAGGE